nr:mismatch repair protein [Tranzscheliella williamsii]
MEEDHDQPALSSEAESARYRPIKKLEESVVNRIAAGEIIHRPANALKELIENSLDAGATIIRITLKEGGIKMLQIQDNGSGIRPADLPLLCERFATSKLRAFDDLNSMSTFGFRGEALASISYVTASLHVISKTRDQECAYKAYYANGALAPPKPGQSSEPKQCAGTDGTLITAEDLFYNVPQRRRALRSAADEYNRALDIVSKYAVHYGGRGIGFVCRKASSNATDLNSPSSPTNTTLDTIRLLHGNAVARELVQLDSVSDQRLGFTVQGWISGANWSSKRTTMLCFINNRLVDCPLLKRSLEALYSTLLPKGGHPWIYLSLSINPANVDVNVHPTKKEVHFLNEDEIVEVICQAAQNKLAGANSSRAFSFSQAVLPIIPKEPRASSQLNAPPRSGDDPHPYPETSTTSERRRSSSSSVTGAPLSSSKGYPQHLVRVDAKVRTLDSMLASTSQAGPQSSSAATLGKRKAQDLVIQQDSSSESPHEPQEEAPSAKSTAVQAGPGKKSRQPTTRITDSPCSLSSIQHLRDQMTKFQHRNLAEIVQNHTYVGVVDLARGLSLIQHETKLLLVNHDAFIQEFAYHLILRQFGKLQRLRLDPAPSLDELVLLGLELTEGASKADGQDMARAKAKIVDVLLEHAEMLEEYFSFCLGADQRTLTALPNLLPGGSAGPGADPCALVLDRLPQLLLRLAMRVHWDDEERCFETFARQLAWACLPSALDDAAAECEQSGDADADDAAGPRRAEADRTRKKIQHLWFDNMSKSKGRYLPSKETNDYVVQVAKLPDLCKCIELPNVPTELRRPLWLLTFGRFQCLLLATASQTASLNAVDRCRTATLPLCRLGHYCFVS